MSVLVQDMASVPHTPLDTPGAAIPDLASIFDEEETRWLY